MTAELLEYTLSTMEALRCPKSLTVAVMARHGMWTDIAELVVKPEDYDCPERLFFDSQALAFVQKLSNLPGSESAVRRKRAVDKWIETEKTCKRTNDRLSPYLSNEASGPPDERIYSFLESMRKNVRMMIGPSPPPTWEGRFGPGATVSDKSALATVPDKISSVPTFSPNALYHLVPWSGTLWAAHAARVSKSPRCVRGNRYFTVPKNASIDRSCAMEPSLNVFYQLGLGALMKDRLARVGLDLKDGKIAHMRKAYEASRFGDFATIDLSSASDTVCTNLVKLVLPPAWFSVLNSLRSPFTEVDGKWWRLEKFSSMGNGFTFELETVIFASICMAAVPGASLGDNVMVFGDDIIVPTSSADDVMSALRFFGFNLNPKKSFSRGSFRESCGGDYFNGVPVRPYFPTVVPERPEHYISFYNGVRRACLGYTMDGLTKTFFGAPESIRERRVRSLLRTTMGQLPRLIRACKGPEVLGDIVIHSSEWTTRWRSQIGYLRVYRPLGPKRALERGFADSAVLAAACYGAQVDPPWRSLSGRFPRERGWALRGAQGYKLGWVTYS